MQKSLQVCLIDLKSKELHREILKVAQVAIEFRQLIKMNLVD